MEQPAYETEEEDRRDRGWRGELGDAGVYDFCLEACQL
jgi:hypothetical protein